MGLKSLLPLRANCGQTSHTTSIASLMTTTLSRGAGITERNWH
jgi:hypothetical protein